MTTAYLISELARRIDVGPRDVLDALYAVGVERFWHEGERFDADQLRAYLARDHWFDPVAELEIDLTEAQESGLAAWFMCEAAELRFDNLRS